MVERDARHQKTVDGALSKMKYALGDVERANQKVRGVVRDARAAGATWAEIGAALGMSGQGAQKRYGSKSDRAAANVAHEALVRQKAARKRCPVCGAKFATPEAVEAHVRAAECTDAPGPGDPWPDGSTQGTIGSDDEERSK
jgi:hypothetical protein